MSPMTLAQRKAIAQADDERPKMACSDRVLVDRLRRGARIWRETREPLAMAQCDRLLDEMNRRRRIR